MPWFLLNQRIPKPEEQRGLLEPKARHTIADLEQVLLATYAASRIWESYQTKCNSLLVPALKTNGLLINLLSDQAKYYQCYKLITIRDLQRGWPGDRKGDFTLRKWKKSVFFLFKTPNVLNKGRRVIFDGAECSFRGTDLSRIQEAEFIPGKSLILFNNLVLSIINQATI